MLSNNIYTDIIIKMYNIDNNVYFALNLKLTWFADFFFNHSSRVALSNMFISDHLTVQFCRAFLWISLSIHGRRGVPWTPSTWAMVTFPLPSIATGEVMKRKYENNTLMAQPLNKEKVDLKKHSLPYFAAIYIWHFFIYNIWTTRCWNDNLHCQFSGMHLIVFHAT